MTSLPVAVDIETILREESNADLTNYAIVKSRPPKSQKVRLESPDKGTVVIEMSRGQGVGVMVMPGFSEEDQKFDVLLKYKADCEDAYFEILVKQYAPLNVLVDAPRMSIQEFEVLMAGRDDHAPPPNRVSMTSLFGSIGMIRKNAKSSTNPFWMLAKIGSIQFEDPWTTFSLY